MARLSELPLLAQPGERWLYSAGSQVLGVLAARAADAPFEDVMRERVLAPLGMDDTAFYAGDTGRLATAYERRDGELAVSDPPDGQWSRPPRFPDGAGGLVSTAEDLLRFGRMLLRPGGNPVLTAGTVAEMTRDQLTPAQRANVWPGFSFLDDRGWGYGVSVTEWGYTWDGGLGTSWSNIGDQDLTVVVLTQRAADEAGLPAVCEQVRMAMSS
jgi:CubicO group peptidase (beta-lactamase class C family)